MRWLLAGVLIVVAGASAWALTRPDDPPLEYGAPGFPARGELMRDGDLVEAAADAWRRSSTRPGEGPIRAIWAGRDGDERKVVLRAANRTVTIVFDEDDERGDLYRTEGVSEGSPIVLARDGVLVREGLPERWTEVSRDGPEDAEPGSASYSGDVLARDGFVPYDDDEDFIALAPKGSGDGDLVPVLLGGVGARASWPAVVPLDDWPEVRRQITQDAISTLAGRALAAAAATLTRPTSPVPVVRLLPGAELPESQVAYVAAARAGGRTAIAFATGDLDDPDADLLGISDQEPALAAKPVAGALVVAGEPGIARLEIRAGERTIERRGSFAYLPGVAEAEVIGFTRDGREIQAETDGG